MAVITVEPVGKTSFVYSCMQARLIGQLNGEGLMSLVCEKQKYNSHATASLESRVL